MFESTQSASVTEVASGKSLALRLLSHGLVTVLASLENYINDPS